MKSTQDISAQRRVRCGKDERDRQIDVQSKSYAAEIMVTVAVERTNATGRLTCSPKATRQKSWSPWQRF